MRRLFFSGHLEILTIQPTFESDSPRRRATFPPSERRNPGNRLLGQEIQGDTRRWFKPWPRSLCSPRSLSSPQQEVCLWEQNCAVTLPERSGMRWSPAPTRISDNVCSAFPPSDWSQAGKSLIFFMPKIHMNMRSVQTGVEEYVSNE